MSLNKSNTVVHCLFNIFKSTCFMDDIQLAIDGKESTTAPAKNVAAAYNFISGNKTRLPREADVAHIHHLLYRNLDRFAGIYRRYGEGWEAIPQKVDTWVQTWTESGKKDDCLKRYDLLLEIRPFADGNRRLGKTLLLWDLLHNKVRTDTIRKIFQMN